MNKKLIALAVAGATFAPAVMAQTANPVTLYGRVFLSVNSVKADGGATPLSTRTTVVDESSLIGFRGIEDLGGGLKAFFQVESGILADTGGGTWASRNSGVGLQGGFGSIVIGKWDSPFKVTALIVDPAGQLTIANQLSVINTGDFNRRENNMMQYWTPNLNGFSARFMYGANELKTSTNPIANPSNASMSFDYAAGPFRVNYAYEKHKDTRGNVITAGVTETGQMLVGSFVFGPVKVAALTQKIKSTNLTDRKAYEVAVTYTAGKNAFFVNVGRNKGGLAASAILQPESKLAAIGYDYSFSKRTTFMARYARLLNNAASSAALSTSQLPAFAVNNDPKGLGVSLRHTF